jgi:hypothetical protein
MMTLSEFLSEHIGKTVGYPDGKYVGECLSLAKWYIKDCFEISPPASGSNSAFGYWSNFPSPLGTKFKKVEYKSGMIIPCGAIPIWNTKVGEGYGHIAVRTNKVSTTANFESLDQNWGTKVATLVLHTYTNLQGWLEPIESSIIDTMEKLPKDNVLKDIRTALCGSFSQDEIDADLASNKNLVEIITGICEGDEKFKNKWIMPEIAICPPPVSYTPYSTSSASTEDSSGTVSTWPTNTTLNLFQKIGKWFNELLGK